METLASEVMSHCHREGFQGVGIVAPDPSRQGEFMRWWTERGFHGEMSYLARPEALERRADPSQLCQQGLQWDGGSWHRGLAVLPIRVAALGGLLMDVGQRRVWEGTGLALLAPRGGHDLARRIE